MFCVYWDVNTSSFNIPAVIQSVCLQASDQVGARAKSFELLTHRLTQVYMNLLWFENLLLMRLWVWNTYLVLLWNRALAYPRALLPSGDPIFTPPCDLRHAIPWPHVILSSAQIQIYLRTNHLGKQRKQIVWPRVWLSRKSVPRIVSGHRWRHSQALINIHAKITPL